MTMHLVGERREAKHISGALRNSLDVRTYGKHVAAGCSVVFKRLASAGGL